MRNRRINLRQMTSITQSTLARLYVHALGSDANHTVNSRMHTHTLSRNAAPATACCHLILASSRVLQT